MWFETNLITKSFRQITCHGVRTWVKICSLISELLFLLMRSWGSHQIQILQRVCRKNFCFFPPNWTPFDIREIRKENKSSSDKPYAKFEFGVTPNSSSRLLNINRRLRHQPQRVQPKKLIKLTKFEVNPANLSSFL